MPKSSAAENEFTGKLRTVIEENISDEEFGVSELAHAMGMSRSNLLRRINKITGQTASQFIRGVRLENAMEMLKEGSFNVSEVSYRVGFNSSSYFIKCFREHYGFPPGELGKKGLDDPRNGKDEPHHPAHQLAAIMFTDIEGYTALMQKDEQTALAFRNRHREVFNAAIEKYNGKVLQYYGDGTLSTFPSAIDAVRSAIEMQLAFRTEPMMPVRVGIHQGDIIFTEDDIIGDGVNVASRIESLAVAGSVFISEKVFDEIKNQPGIQAKTVGNYEFKNVDKPIEVYAISNPGLIVPDKKQLEGKGKRASGVKSPGGVRQKALIFGLPALGIMLLIAYLVFLSDVFHLNLNPSSGSDASISKKSIAVLPFINDSDDSSNAYIINGLMESVLNKLQKIKNLRVISRTSVEKYRNNPKTLPEIGEELNVNYVIEGSGQKIGDRIMLTIQLVEAPSDRHLWSEQYTSTTNDIFTLQQDIAKKIAGEIRVFITPEEKARIDKIPTENMVAYDHYLKGREMYNNEDYKAALDYYKKAIQEDSTFALAYAGTAICYFFLDFPQAEKQYSELINRYADKALLYDPKQEQSLIAKALYYYNIGEYDQALPHLEKASEYNPNSALVNNTLADLYARYIPNTSKYLEYAIRGVGIDVGGQDSVTTSYTYLHLSNALIQSGFVDEAEHYIRKSLAYDPQNIYSLYVQAYILYAENRDLHQLQELLISTLQKDSTRLDVLQEVGKSFYFNGEYEKAYQYYKRFIDITTSQNLNIFRYENAKIGFVLAKVGRKVESEKYFNDFREFAEQDPSIYKNLHLASYYSYRDETKKALEHLELFSQEQNFQYWFLVFDDVDPLYDNIRDLPEYKRILKKIEKKFWEYHDTIKKSLQDEGLI